MSSRTLWLPPSQLRSDLAPRSDESGTKGGCAGGKICQPDGGLRFISTVCSRELRPLISHRVTRGTRTASLLWNLPRRHRSMSSAWVATDGQRDIVRERQLAQAANRSFVPGPDLPPQEKLTFTEVGERPSAAIRCGCQKEPLDAALNAFLARPCGRTSRWVNRHQEAFRNELRASNVLELQLQTGQQRTPRIRWKCARHTGTDHRSQRWRRNCSRDVGGEFVKGASELLEHNGRWSVRFPIIDASP